LDGLVRVEEIEEKGFAPEMVPANIAELAGINGIKLDVRCEDISVDRRNPDEDDWGDYTERDQYDFEGCLHEGGGPGTRWRSGTRAATPAGCGTAVQLLGVGPLGLT
jgi:hypothetical protein